MNRRDLMLAAAAAPALAAGLTRAQAQENDQPAPAQGRLKQSVMFQVWGFPTAVIPSNAAGIRQRCEILADLGYAGVDWIGMGSNANIAIAREYGLEVSLMQAANATSQAAGAIRATQQQFDNTVAGLETAAQERCPNLIVIPGELRGMSREEGRDNLIDFLGRLAPFAEELGVNVCIEPTNNRVEADARTDTIFNHLDFGIDVLRQVDSPRVKLLYDFYHTQVQDGDVTRRFLENVDLVCHIQTAGTPTRAELGDDQELNYRYIAKVIADSGYDGYVGHEFYLTPGRDPRDALAEAFEIFNV